MENYWSEGKWSSISGKIFFFVDCSMRLEFREKSLVPEGGRRWQKVAGRMEHCDEMQSWLLTPRCRLFCGMYLWNSVECMSMLVEDCGTKMLRN